MNVIGVNGKYKLETLTLMQKFLPIKDSYSTFVYHGAQFLQEFYSTDSIYHLSFMFQYMLYHGYFSISPFKYDAKTSSNYGGMRVLGGRGHCVHISAFYRDLFHVLLSHSSAKVYTLEAYIPKNDDEDLNLRTSSALANHENNIILDTNKVYFYDGTNKDFIVSDKYLTFNYTFLAHYVKDKDDTLLYLDSLFDKLNRNNISSVLYLLSNQAPIKRKELKAIKREVYHDCKKNLSLILDFYAQNERYVQDVGTYILKRK